MTLYRSNEPFCTCLNLSGLKVHLNDSPAISWSGNIYMFPCCASLQKNCLGGVFGDNSGIFLSNFATKTYAVGSHLNNTYHNIFLMENCRNLSHYYHQKLLNDSSIQ